MNDEVKIKIGDQDTPGMKRKIVDESSKVEDSCYTTDDPWALPELQDQGVKWSDLSGKDKAARICINILKAIALLVLLYFFICSLSFLSSAFRLLGGKEAGRIFSGSSLLKNPVVGLMIGVLATVVVQSSSTSTSIVITMVGADMIKVRNAIPIIMGANIGTSVTNTIVSLTQVADRNEFRRAFAAATVHDMFNWLTVIVLLPLEIATGYLEKLTGVIMDSTTWKKNSGVNKEFLTVITKPFTNLIIQLDKKILNVIAINPNSTDAFNKSLIKQCYKNGTQTRCGFLFERLGISDAMVGLILLAVSLVLLATCLILLVKLLHSMLKGQIAVTIRKIVNSEPRFPFSILVGYAAILVGVGMTILVQSSSIFTSALTPLAGIGVISINRMYPLTLGSNIGTTTTGIFAAFAVDSRKLHDSLQIAFCHFFFNVTGILIFYPLPFMRFPIVLAKLLGNTTAKYRWFSIFYLLLMFVVLPLFVFSLSLAGFIALMSVGIPLLILLVLIVIINIIQKKRPSLLPEFLRNWNWLPECLHSLDPYDRIISKICGMLGCCAALQNRRDSKFLPLPPNQSEINILHSCDPSLTTIDCHNTKGIDNSAFGWKKSHSTKL